jgi:tRNA(adenine34) deaminase
MGGEVRGRTPGDERDEAYMALALREAKRAFERDEIPVGAVIVAAGTVVAKAHNQNVELRDPTAHAEMIALTQAAAALENDRLSAATLYVTLEPCAMCAGAITWARLARVVYGAADEKAGACGSALTVLGHPRLAHHPEVVAGVLGEDAARLLREFFAGKRAVGPRPAHE